MMINLSFSVGPLPYFITQEMYMNTYRFNFIIIICMFFLQNIQVYKGNYPALEKGPLTKILGGPELLDQIKESENQNSKSLVLSVICCSCFFVYAFISLMRKLKYRKIDHYTPVFNRFKSVYNLFGGTCVIFGK